MSAALVCRPLREAIREHQGNLPEGDPSSAPPAATLFAPGQTSSLQPPRRASASILSSTSPRLRAPPSLALPLWLQASLPGHAPASSRCPGATTLPPLASTAAPPCALHASPRASPPSPPRRERPACLESLRGMSLLPRRRRTRAARTLAVLFAPRECPKPLLRKARTRRRAAAVPFASPPRSAVARRAWSSRCPLFARRRSHLASPLLS